MKRLIFTFSLFFLFIYTRGQSIVKHTPLDPQKVRDQDEMTWTDYRPVPGVNWADPNRNPTGKKFRIAIVTADFEDQPFVVTLPKGSDPYGNPQISPIKREQVPQFYADFWNKPQNINKGHTIHEYWMEQSRGSFGITVKAFGPYRMAKKSFQYGMPEVDMPAGYHADKGMTKEVDSLWKAEQGKAIGEQFDVVLRIFGGYDETTVWQEFGEMKFQNKESITADWGNPDPAKPRWAKTRYTDWTSWKSASWLWSNSAIIQGESSGSIRHEISHFAFKIGDNNNNPYVEPYRRTGAGPWDIMDRGSFNGPGGPHRRWLVPVMEGGAMPAGLMLRQKMKFGFVDSSRVLILKRDALASSGLVLADVTAREVEPAKGAFAGIVVRLDGAAPQDRTPKDDPVKNPLSAGIPDYNFYSLEVVQRIGYDSFTPDNGVLIAKNKDKESTNGGPNDFRVFNWVIDANPEDKKLLDFKRPDGTPVLRTIADYRQLNDALFHAGLNSGSNYEWIDSPNRLHFYVVDLTTSPEGVRTYKLAVRSLDGSGPYKRGTAVKSPEAKSIPAQGAAVNFSVSNTGEKADVYRLSVSVDGKGWSAGLQNALLGLTAGAGKDIAVSVTRVKGVSAKGTLTFTATSESDPSKKVIRQVSLNP
jgi:M6 family metalloprotease-like protein